MIGDNQDPNIGKDTQFLPGQSGNPDGRPKGTKNLATLIRELEHEDFDWSLVPLKPESLAKAKKMGAPFKAVVMSALAKAFAGDTKAMEWLRKAGYGDKLDVTSNGETVAPLVLSTIQPQPAEPTPEKEEEKSPE